MLNLPIGQDNFAKIINNQLDFVDKSLFIKEILDSKKTEVTIITRPRRFGKTLNLSMLHHFLAPEILGSSTEGLFKGLKIMSAGEGYQRHHRHYPVIFITFKTIKDHNFETACAQLCSLMRKVYDGHQYLLNSPRLSTEDKLRYQSILQEKPVITVLESALEDLCRYLFLHHGVKPWLLIDEYDTPIQSAYLHGYYEEMISLMRNMFGAALKTNPYLDRAVLTGILRIAKESLFSELNNVKVYTLLNDQYSQYFGFTEEEVTDLLKRANLSAQSKEIRAWYNGYQIGKTVIYNPWSLVNCIDEKGTLKPHWVNTGDTRLIQQLLARGDQNLKQQLEWIIKGESIEATIDENIVFKDLDLNTNAVWSLLLFSGYLKAISCEPHETKQRCWVTSPNQEVLALYRDIIQNWIAAQIGDQEYQDFLLSLTEGRIDEFNQRLEKYLQQTISVFDSSGREPGKSTGLLILTCEARAEGSRVMEDPSQKFYHGLVLGMMVSLSKTHEVNSNRESGYGRYDVMLIPKNPNKLGIILEFKIASSKESDLEVAAQKALEQIRQRNYLATLQQKGIKKVLQMGLAFKGKAVAIAFEEIMI